MEKNPNSLEAVQELYDIVSQKTRILTPEKEKLITDLVRLNAARGNKETVIGLYTEFNDLILGCGKLSPKIFFFMAKALESSGRVSDAFDIYKKIIIENRQHPLCSKAYSQIGKIFYSNGQIDKAKKVRSLPDGYYYRDSVLSLIKG